MHETTWKEEESQIEIILGEKEDVQMLNTILRRWIEREKWEEVSQM